MSFVKFENITRSSGITDIGESWGIAFGDFNNDGWVDVWLNNHLKPQKLYINQQDGSFIESGRRVLTSFTREDNHGALWFDLDNDGDQDLLQLNGGGGGKGSIPNFLFINHQGRLIETSADFNLDYPLGRGRMPLVFDHNQDGLLDVFLGVADRSDQLAPPALFQQDSDGRRFENVSAEIGLSRVDGVVGQISHLSGSPQPELIVLGQTQTVYSTQGSVLSDVTADFGLNQLRTSDFAIADFNNDLRPDIFQVTDRIQSTIFRDTSTQFKLFGRSRRESLDQQGVDFRTEGSLRIELPALRKKDIFLGAMGINPSNDQLSDQVLRLTQSEDEISGLKSLAVDAFGIAIGYDKQQDLWQVRWSNASGKDIFSRIKSSTRIQDINPINFDPIDSLSRDSLFINTSEGFIKDKNAGIALSTAGKSVVAADFDNDMDIDLYVVSATKVGNPSNVFYQNLGDGTFKLTGAGPARGTTQGVGGAAATADVNNDGFLDLLVANGGAFLGNSKTILDNGPTELFLNRRNGYKWIALDLEGRFSNRDGIGAQVFTTAGGITQLREQNGGIQFQVQNHSRIHFGLAKNRQADQIEVKWSSGLTQTLFNVAARQVLKVTEGIGYDGQDLIHGLDTPESLAGQKGKDEIHGGGGNDTLSGDQGRDTLFGNAGKDLLMGGVGNDTLYGNEDNDFIQGDKGDDLLIGGSGQDKLLGGEGRDWLFGEIGRDRLNGGVGQDSFQLNALNKGLTLIEDFEQTADRIVIERSIYSSSLSLGTLSPDQFTLGSGASTSNHRFIYNKNQGELRFDPDGTGSRQSVRVAKLLGGADLDASRITVL